MITCAHIGDIHAGCGSAHATTVPGSALSSRDVDLFAALDRVFARAAECDLCAIPGDLWHNANPTATHQHELSRRIAELARKVPVALCPGNHDQNTRDGAANTSDLFRSLGVPGVTVFRKPGAEVIETKSGPIIVAALPFVPKARLLTQDATRGLGIAEATALLVQVLVKTLDDLALKVEDLRKQTDLDLPACLIGHWSVEGCTTGGWTPQAIGGAEAVLPLKAVQNPAWDCSLWNHIHRPQTVSEAYPLVTYAGSVERVDFSEADEERTYSIVSVERGHATIERHSTGARPFLTIDLGLCTDVPAALAPWLPKVRGTIARVTYQLPPGAPTPPEREVRTALLAAGAVHVSGIRRAVPEREVRARSEAVLQAQGPLQTLEAFFDHAKTEPAVKERLLAMFLDQVERRAAEGGAV